MTILLFLGPASVVLGLIALGACIWAITSRQYEDPVGAAHRILVEDDEPLV